VAGLVVRDAVRMASVGGIVGAAVALTAAPLVQSMLFQTSAREPLPIIGAAGLLLVVTVGAAMGPALRAGRVSPMTVLRRS
jgi:ABC-type antimicrobial peptide transport system permease subunit